MDIDFSAVKRILVIKLRHIGDVLLTVPVFRALRENFPGAHIAALVNSGTGDVLTDNPQIDEVISLDRNMVKLGPARRYAGEINFLRMIRGMHFDLTVDLTGGDRAAIISFVSGAKYRIGRNPKKGFIGKKHLYTHIAYPRGKEHTTLKNLSIVKQFGCTTRDLTVDVHITESDRQSVRSLLDKHGMKKGAATVHVHPTSRWLFKCWRDDYMAEVMSGLTRVGANVVVTSSPEKKELEKVNNILSLLPQGTQIVNLAGVTSVKQLAAISEISDLFFGIDTGPMHIAAAMRRPVVALFGPTDARRWGPWDNDGAFREYSGFFHSPYGRKNGIQTAGEHTVVQRSWDCVPCGKKGCNRSKTSKCLEDVKPEEVLRIIIKILEKRSLPRTSIRHAAEAIQGGPECRGSSGSA